MAQGKIIPAQQSSSGSSTDAKFPGFSMDRAGRKMGITLQGKETKLSTRSTSTKHKGVERSKVWLLFSVTKFKTFLSSHTCTSKHHHSNHDQVRVWNPSESEINHSNYSRWAWNCHLCWQTPPSPQTQKSAFKTQKPWTTPQHVRKHQPPLNSGYTCPQNHKIHRKLTVTHDMFAVRLTLGCSLTNT